MLVNDNLILLHRHSEQAEHHYQHIPPGHGRLLYVRWRHRKWRCANTPNPSSTRNSDLLMSLRDVLGRMVRFNAVSRGSLLPECVHHTLAPHPCTTPLRPSTTALHHTYVPHPCTISLHPSSIPLHHTFAPLHDTLATQHHTLAP